MEILVSSEMDGNFLMAQGLFQGLTRLNFDPPNVRLVFATMISAKNKDWNTNPLAQHVHPLLCKWIDVD